MTKREKLIGKIRARPPHADFEDVRRVLDLYGWTMRAPRSGSSHYTFAKAGEPEIITVVKHHGRVGRVYLDNICEKLGLD
ncbi:MAG: type II toxin-antitoxin system HicA family toxin [Chloroflexia bacterium]|nr:type II toxin-antitoxin system HicA family toxin [Chloroflexia bacterium]